jgi:spermidine synthase
LIVFLLFFLSGFTGLVYEVLWSRLLILVLGNTALAQSLVLGVFLGGLALGNLILGARSDKQSQPLRFYGILELGIGIMAVLSPWLLGIASRFYFQWAKLGLSIAFGLGFKAALCMIIVLFPAFLMGGTLPALSRFLIGSQKRSYTALSWLYFTNCAGASLGALASGFWLIPSYGLNFPFIARRP